MATLSPLYRALVAAAAAATGAQGYTDVREASAGDPGPAIADAVTLGLLGAGLGTVSRLESFLPPISSIDGSAVELTKISATRASAITKIEEIQVADEIAIWGPLFDQEAVTLAACSEQCQEVLILVGSFIASTDVLADMVLPGVPIALIFIQTLRLLDGFGVPDKGEEFRTAAAEWSGVSDNLRWRHSPGAWGGAAAERYQELITSQRACAAPIQEADSKLADILHTQAAQVQDSRIGLAAIDPICMLAIPYIYWLRRALIGECDRLVVTAEQWAEEHVTAASQAEDILAKGKRMLFWSENLRNNSILLKTIISVVYEYLTQYVAIVIGVMLAAGTAALTVLSMLIDQSRSNAEDINNVTKIYRSVAGVQLGEFRGSSSPPSGQAAHRTVDDTQSGSVPALRSAAQRGSYMAPVTAKAKRHQLAGEKPAPASPAQETLAEVPAGPVWSQAAHVEEAEGVTAALADRMWQS